MPADKKSKVVVKKIELEVLVEGHVHKGEHCEKGSKIMVSEEVAKMLKKAWKKPE